jgi:hypothetical protein
MPPFVLQPAYACAGMCALWMHDVAVDCMHIVVLFTGLALPVLQPSLTRRASAAASMLLNIHLLCQLQLPPDADRITWLAVVPVHGMTQALGGSRKECISTGRQILTPV